eukprot:15445840-Alexandrium_andersonii.AAC.1
MAAGHVRTFQEVKQGFQNLFNSAASKTARHARGHARQDPTRKLVRSIAIPRTHTHSRYGQRPKAPHLRHIGLVLRDVRLPPDLE